MAGGSRKTQVQFLASYAEMRKKRQKASDPKLWKDQICKWLSFWAGLWTLCGREHQAKSFPEFSSRSLIPFAMHCSQDSGLGRHANFFPSESKKPRRDGAFLNHATVT
ncbi:hypothetical protein ACEUZ9_004708 [Paracoccus litorisediminis]|uniref:hypothetical protein n=1 Tax=Paracoccus litorisediminis TaxID=2006130 RepID=UPI0037338D46